MSPERISTSFRINDLASNEHVKEVYEKFATSKPKKPQRSVHLFQILLDLYTRELHLKTGITEKLVTSELKKKIRSDPLFWQKERRTRMESAKSYINRFKRHLKGFDLEFKSVSLCQIDDTVKDKSKNTYVFLKPVSSVKSEEIHGSWQELRKRCASHSRAMIKQLKHKYNPDLYISRINAEREFDSFLRSDKNLLLVIGNSGKGKTNLLCNLVDSAEYPTIFFSGEFFAQNPFHLQDELEAIFAPLWASEKTDSRNSLVEANRLAQSTGQNILVAVDALNEFNQRAAVFEEIVQFITKSAVTFPTLKFCLSCRTESWVSLTQKDGINLPLDLIFSTEGKDFSRWRSDSAPHGLILGDYDDKELNQAIQRYMEIFNVNGDLSAGLHQICADPFFMRVVFEVYGTTSLPFDIARSSISTSFGS